MRPGDAPAWGELELVVLREVGGLLGRQRREHVADRARLDAHDFRVGEVVAHLGCGAHDLARGAVEAQELLGLLVVLEHVREAERVEARALADEDRCPSN